MYYAVIRDSSNKIIALEKVDSEGFDVCRVQFTGTGYTNQTYTHAQINKTNNKIMYAFEGLEKNEPGDPKFLLGLLASLTPKS